MKKIIVAATLIFASIFTYAIDVPKAVSEAFAKKFPLVQ